MDITTVFGTVFAGSSPAGCTKSKEKPLQTRGFSFSVRVGRIELPSRPWQGRVLPLNHTRKLTLLQYQFSPIKTRKPAKASFLVQADPLLTNHNSVDVHSPPAEKKYPCLRLRGTSSNHRPLLPTPYW